jgi:hypothetical protein
MATILLSEASKLGYDDLSAGVAESISTANGLLGILPFNTVQGNAYAYNREGTPGNVKAMAIGGSTTNVKTQATFTQITQGLTTILGDAEVNSLIVAQGVGTGAGGQDPVAAAIASKAKQIGREYMRLIAVGNSAALSASVSGVTNEQEFDGLETLLASSDFAGQIVAANDATLTAELLDQLTMKVLVGDPQFIMAHGAGIRKIMAILRGYGGVTYMDVAGVQTPMWNGIPLIRNDYLTADTSATAGTQVSIFAGSFDDGSRTGGLSGIIPAAGGVNVQGLGPAEAGDYDIWRVKMYGGFAIHSVLSVAALTKVTV